MKIGTIRNIVTVCGLMALLASSCKEKTATTAAQTGSGDPTIDRISARIEKDPKNDSLYYYRGRQYWELEAYDQAIADATKAIALDSLKPAYYLLLADAHIDYARPNDSKRALNIMEKACAIFTEDKGTYLRTAEFYLIVRQYNDALKKLDHVLKRDPLNAEAYFITGRVTLDQGDTLRTIKSLQKAVQLDASNKEAWVFLGRIFSNRFNNNAIQFYDNALRLDSTDVQVQEYKAAHYKRMGNFDKAFALYRKIIIEHPDYSNAFFDMGLIYLEQDSLNKAHEHFNQAIRTDPLFVIAYYYRGVASESKGDTKAAIEDYKQALKMSPNLPEPKKALERLKVEI
jgi:tetratricopeptide (TPR) repeat protein